MADLTDVDVRVYSGFFSHVKTKKLIRRAGYEAAFRFIQLWTEVRKTNPDGQLPGYTIEDIELLVDWGGTPELLVRSLVEVGYLDETPEGFAVHDWRDHQPHAYKTKIRSDAGKRGAAKRWGHLPSGNEEADAKQAGSKADSKSMAQAQEELELTESTAIANEWQTDSTPDSNGHGKPMANAEKGDFVNAFANSPPSLPASLPASQPTSQPRACARGGRSSPLGGHTLSTGTDPDPAAWELAERCWQIFTRLQPGSRLARTGMMPTHWAQETQLLLRDEIPPDEIVEACEWAFSDQSRSGSFTGYGSLKMPLARVVANFDQIRVAMKPAKSLPPGESFAEMTTRLMGVTP